MWSGELLDRARAIVTNERNTAPVSLLPKNHIFTTHPAILAMAYRMWQKADFVGFPPSPNELLEADLGYLNEILAFAEIVQFVRDEHKENAL